MAATLEAFDEVATASCGATLAAWVTAGDDLDATPLRCPVGERDAAALARLDLALRMLRGQEPSQWCRAAGDATAVVRSWSLPARGISLHDDDGRATAMVLAYGRAGGGADLWRFRFDGAPTALLDRGRALLPT